MNNKSPRILIVDNYDSFTFNLVQILQEHGGCNFDVMKNDAVNIAYAAMYDGFLFSPGPGIPDEAPLMTELLREYHNKKSFLGICLGHQAIAETFGMKLVKLDTVRHGLKTTIRIIDPVDYIFEGMPTEFKAGLYHSWAVSDESKIPKSVSNLRVTALGNDGIIMAIAHVRYDIRGVQFHPESYLSEYGHIIIHNWINHLSCGRSSF
jgi:anthranilate synthase component II